MTLTNKISKALAFAAKAHEGQYRKDEAKTPYIAHPYAVAVILSQFTDDEDVISAGLLHDTIEDCGKTKEELTNLFGERVAQFVSEVTEDMELKSQGEKESWRQRKEKYLANLEHDSKEALMICAADKIHNLISMKEAYDVMGEKLWDNFNSPPEGKLWFYEEVSKVIRKKLGGGLADMLEEALQNMKKEL